MRLIIASFLILNSYFSFAQIVKEQKSATVTYDLQPESSYENSEILVEKIPDSLIEMKDDRIDLLIQDFTDHKKNYGYRIQLFSGNSRWEAQKVKNDFLSTHEEKSSYLIYQQPNFKIRVGDYKNRLEAAKFLELYKVDFPSAFVVKDEIELMQKK